jgi:hypothetical protein
MAVFRADRPAGVQARGGKASRVLSFARHGRSVRIVARTMHGGILRVRTAQEGGGVGKRLISLIRALSKP